MPASSAELIAGLTFSHWCCALMSQLIREVLSEEMSILTKEQSDRALETMREFLDSTDDEGKPVWEKQQELDDDRIKLIRGELQPLLTKYLAGDLELKAFKTRIDSLNKRHEYWGFKGIKGQMFFNMILNVSEDEAETDQELKAAFAAPTSDAMAKSRLNTFTSYVRRIGDEFVESGGSKHGRPKVNSSAFFLSYFWQIQAPEVWPVYYTNSVNTMVDLNLWRPTENLASDYLEYKRVHEELASLFTKQSGKEFGLYDVEHVFWIKGGNPFGGLKPIKQPGGNGGGPRPDPEPTAPIVSQELRRLPDSFVPPVVSILPRLAANDPTLEDAAKASGTNIARAFEKNIDAAFTIIGYDSKLLGQGKGRVPDGVAQDHDNSYAIIWDAKARADGYSMGTDDRTIREYIATQSRELKRKRTLRNIYYAIISSGFQEDHDDAIRELKMETDVSEVCLLTAEALVAIVDAKLRDPMNLSLGSDGLQRLFCHSGVVSVDSVRSLLA